MRSIIINQPVRLAIQIRLVNLLDIAGKHHFCTLSGTGDDGFDFMGGQVLRFIYDTISIAQATPHG